MGKKHTKQYLIPENFKKVRVPKYSFLSQNLGNTQNIVINDQTKITRKKRIKANNWTEFLSLYLSHRHNPCSFSNLVLITQKLAEFPATYFAGKRRKLLATLIARINYALEYKLELPLKNGYHCLFSALLKLPLDFLRYQHIFAALAYKCLEPLAPESLDKTTIETLGFTMQSFWIISSVAHAQYPKEPKINAIFTKAHDLIASFSTEEIAGSATQSMLTQKIRILLSPVIQPELKTEYPLGIYHLDIALPQQKLAIEVDGIHHYTNRRLRNPDILRDFIVKYIFGWDTIRLPYFEYGRALHHNILTAYLLYKLSSHSNILDTHSELLPRASYIWGRCFFHRQPRKDRLAQQVTQHPPFFHSPT